MSRVDFFQNKGLIIHRVWNITPDEKKDIFEKTSDYPDDSTILSTGYIRPDGKHEYISVTGKSRDELTPIVDENYMEISGNREEPKKIEIPEENIIINADEDPGKYSQPFIDTSVKIERFLTSGWWSYKENYVISSQKNALHFQRSLSNFELKYREFPNLGNCYLGYVNNMSFQKRITNYTSWFGFQNTSVEKFVIIKMKDSNDDIIIPYDNIISSSQIVH